MLRQQYRFHGSAPLRYIYRNGLVVRNANMTYKYTHNERRRSPRFAVVVSKKILKSAVGRNRIRRRLYEIFRRELPYIDHKADIVCIVTSSELRTMATSDLQEQVVRLINQAGLYKKDQANDTIKRYGE